MEISIFKQIKNRVGQLIEPQFLKAGKVLEVRNWVPATLIEIDLHLPAAGMSKWDAVPYIKFRVDNLCYRDYTPFGWDAETHTCTILIDAAHQGPGVRWAQGLHQYDTIHYMAVDTTHHSPDPTRLVVGLGDASSVGHLLALRQKTYPNTRFCGAALLPEPEHQWQLKDYFHSALQAVITDGQDGSQPLLEWVRGLGCCTEHTVFYLAGNHQLVSRLRSLLNAEGYGSAQIKVKGFWS